MPTSVALSGQHAISGASTMLDLVVAGDRLKVIQAWERALAVGASSEVVHTLAEADHPVQLYFVDVRHLHHVFLGVMVGLGGEGTPDVD
jgi:hypothetical protein